MPRQGSPGRGLFRVMRPPWVVLTILYCAGLFWLSAKPSREFPVELFPQADKVVHGVLYGVLAAIVGVGLRRAGQAGPRAEFHAPWVFAALYGLSDELHQLFVPTRSCDALDLAADTAGALMAVWFLRRMRAWRWWPARAAQTKA